MTADNSAQAHDETPDETPDDEQHDDRVATAVERSLPPVLQLAANLWMLLLLCYLVVLPAGLMHIGVPLLGLTGLAGGLVWLARIDTAVRDLRTIIVGFALAGALPVVVGIVNSTPGWRDVAVPLIGGPILWYLASQLPDLDGIRRVPIAVGVGTIVVAAVIAALITKSGTDVVRYVVPKAYGFSIDGEVRANFTGISALIATVPFLAALVVDEYRLTSTLRRHKFIVFALLIGLIAAFLSGRQGVVGAVALIPVLMLATTAMGFSRPRSDASGPPRWRLAIGALVIVGGGLAVATAAGLDPIRLPSDLLSATGLIDEGNARVARSTGVRSAQAESLINGWREQPWLGGGAGVVSPDFFTWRGYELGAEFTTTPRPWRAELAYHLLLFESGLLGCAAYLIAVIVGVRRLNGRFALLAARDQILCRAAIVSALSLAVATAANPIARAVGHQWSFFLPVIVVAAATQGRSRAEPPDPAHESDEPDTDDQPGEHADTAADRH